MVAIAIALIGTELEECTSMTTEFLPFQFARESRLQLSTYSCIMHSFNAGTQYIVGEVPNISSDLFNPNISQMWVGACVGVKTAKAASYHYRELRRTRQKVFHLHTKCNNMHSHEHRTRGRGDIPRHSHRHKHARMVQAGERGGGKHRLMSPEQKHTHTRTHIRTPLFFSL